MKQSDDFPFLIAKYPFDARSLDAQRDPTANCLSFTRGELAYVHSIHSSGWADVTFAHSGERGWVPVDFFSVFRDVRAIPLLAAVAAFLAHPRSMKRPPGIVNTTPSGVVTRSTSSTLNYGGNSPSITEWTFSDAAINEILAGFKLLLKKCGVTDRNSPLVMQFPAIAAARKTLTVEIAHIVRVANFNRYTTDETIIDRLIRACFRLLDRMRLLLVTLDDEERETTSRERREREAQDDQSRASSGGNTRKQSSSHKSSNSSLKSRRSSSSKSLQPWDMSSPKSGIQGDSSIHTNPGSSTSSSSLMTFRSFNDHKTIPSADERVHEVQGALNNYLSKFEDPREILANPEDPQTSPAILSLTRRCMLACRELLVLLDLPPQGYDTIKDSVLDEIRKLVSAARSLVSALPPTPVSLRVAAVNNLTQTASRCRKLSSHASEKLLVFLNENPTFNHSLPERAYPLFELSENAILDDECNVDANPAITQSANFRSRTSSSRSVSRPSISNNNDPDGSSSYTDEDTSSSSYADAHSTPISRRMSRTVTPNKTLDRSLSNFEQSDESTSFSQSDSDINFHSGITPTTSGATTAANSVRSSQTITTRDATQNPWKPLRKYEESELTPSRVRPRTNKSSVPNEDSAVSKSDGIFSKPSPTNASSSALDVSSPLDNELILRNGKVRGGTVRALMSWLLGCYLELEFEMRVFLVTFRLFTSPRDVLIELGSHKDSAAVNHFATLWVSSFFEASDEGVLSSLAPFVGPTVVAARKKIDLQSSKQITPLRLQPEGSTMGAGRSTSNSSTSFGVRGASGVGATSQSSRSASTTSLPGNLWRNPSLNTQFGTHSTLNLAAQFRELGLSGRRTSRHASTTSLSETNINSLPSSVISEELLSRVPADIAAQVTLMWFEVFKKIRVSELLDQRFSASKRQLGLAPNVSQLVESSNYLTAFVGDTILARELSVKQRARVVKHWLKIANEMYSLGNINGTVTIVSTLKSTRLVRLSRVWESLSAKTQTLLDNMAPIAAPERNFAECRKLVRTKSDENAFCIPFMGILLGDLVLIDEGNPKTLNPEGNSTDETFVNFDRYIKMARAIALVQPFQLHEIDITADLTMQAWIRAQSARSHHRDTEDSDDQWRRSLLIQPLTDK